MPILGPPQPKPCTNNRTPLPACSVQLNVPKASFALADTLIDKAEGILTDPHAIAEINAAVLEASKGALKGILGVTDQPNVSMDFNHDSHSSIFHLDQTKVMDGTFVRVMSWYDNEWGFSNRMSDTAIAMAKLI